MISTPPFRTIEIDPQQKLINTSPLSSTYSNRYHLWQKEQVVHFPRRKIEVKLFFLLTFDLSHTYYILLPVYLFQTF